MAWSDLGMTGGMYTTVGIVVAILLGAIAFSACKGWFKMAHLDEDQSMLIRSWVVPRWALLIVRTAFALYTLTVLLLASFQAADADGWHFEDYSVWAYTSMSGLFFLLAWHSGNDVHRTLMHDDEYDTDGRGCSGLCATSCCGVVARYGCRATWILYQIIFANTILVVGVFWAYEHPHADAGIGMSFTSLNQHGINLGLMLVDMLLNDMVSPLHMQETNGSRGQGAVGWGGGLCARPRDRDLCCARPRPLHATSHARSRTRAARRRNSTRRTPCSCCWAGSSTWGSPGRANQVASHGCAKTTPGHTISWTHCQTQPRPGKGQSLRTSVAAWLHAAVQKIP